MPGKLYIVSTPIGNFRDVTLRALDVLQKSDAVICEEYRQGSTILKKLGIENKDLILLNEHNEQDESAEIAQEILLGKEYALISDCGTPAFADPGTELISRCIAYGLKVIPIPGVSSLMAAISVSPLPLEEFYFAGFLSRKSEIRDKKLSQLKKLRLPVIIMESPYRLTKLLHEICASFGNNQLITLAYNLTLKGEKILHGAAAEILKSMHDQKGEFVVIIHQ